MIPLEKLNQLKSQGKSEQEIIGILQEQGHNPRDITNALNQLKIKDAVNPGQNMSPGMSPSIMSNEEDLESSSVPSPSQNQGNQQQNNSQQPYTPQPAPSQQGYSQPPVPQNNFNSQQNYNSGNQGNQQQNNSQQPYTPQPAPSQQGYSQQNYPPEENYYSNQQYSNSNAYSPQEPPQNYPPEEDYYSQDYSPQGQSYDEYEGYAQPYESTDTIIEISEQVFSEKSKELEDQIKELTEFKRIYEQRINDMNERLKRIEKYFDKMQLAIMEKVTLFGKNIDNLQKEVNMVEDSFSKVVNPLTDKKHPRSPNSNQNNSKRR
jgi:hypothetical protein